jgi:heme exporter protein D
MPSPIAQTTTNLPAGGAETIVWLLVAAVIVGLYLVVRRTRNASRRDYLDRQRREKEMRKNDPDMRDD